MIKNIQYSDSVIYNIIIKSGNKEKVIHYFIGSGNVYKIMYFENSNISRDNGPSIVEFYNNKSNCIRSIFYINNDGYYFDNNHPSQIHFYENKKVRFFERRVKYNYTIDNKPCFVKFNKSGKLYQIYYNKNEYFQTDFFYESENLCETFFKNGFIPYNFNNKYCRIYYYNSKKQNVKMYTYSTSENSFFEYKNQKEFDKKIKLLNIQ